MGAGIKLRFRLPPGLYLVKTQVVSVPSPGLWKHFRHSNENSGLKVVGHHADDVLMKRKKKKSHDDGPYGHQGKVQGQGVFFRLGDF
jgi:hypothetical protein